jgi:hypothetical protein
MARIDNRNLKVKGAKERKVEDHVTGIGKAVIPEPDIAGGDKGVEWEATRAEVHSDTNLEDDKGHGKAIVIRSFDFLANPETFKQQIPTKQELFNAHRIQIEGALFRDDLKVYEDVSPKVIISKNKKYYRIIVAGLPWGMNNAKIPTLSEIANGNHS